MNAENGGAVNETRLYFKRIISHKDHLFNAEVIDVRAEMFTEQLV